MINNSKMKVPKKYHNMIKSIEVTGKGYYKNYILVLEEGYIFSDFNSNTIFCPTQELALGFIKNNIIKQES